MLEKPTWRTAPLRPHPKLSPKLKGLAADGSSGSGLSQNASRNVLAGSVARKLDKLNYALGDKSAGHALSEKKRQETSKGKRRKSIEEKICNKKSIQENLGIGIEGGRKSGR